MVGTWPQAGHHPDWGKNGRRRNQRKWQIRSVQSFLGKAGRVWFSRRRRTRSGPDNTWVYKPCGVPRLDYKTTPSLSGMQEPFHTVGGASHEDWQFSLPLYSLSFLVVSSTCVVKFIVSFEPLCCLSRWPFSPLSQTTPGHQICFWVTTLLSLCLSLTCFYWRLTLSQVPDFYSDIKMTREETNTLYLLRRMRYIPS